MLLAASWWFNNISPHTSLTEHVGFLWGFLHGMFILPNFIYSLFNGHVTIYQSPNSGTGYNLGFMFGALLFYGGGCAAASHE
jgi:hypothetical protein